ncbi:MAG: hypothetical protein VR65_03725 [Desulfobulbaceae bacterium BRH_c16a]|nr:MAG: hypothetical protein VR65_03725 [Desulfobulbaceae bacterium BRH_c16a]
MKIAIISTNDIYGGAALAAYRLHQALNDSGVQSTMIVKKKYSIDPTVIEVGEDKHSQPAVLINESLERHCIKNNRQMPSNSLQPTSFSLDLDDYDLSNNLIVIEADIINIHWCAGFLSARSIAQLFNLGKPVTWTFHDQLPITGGCHYADGCLNYLDNCHPCPQLADDNYGLPSLMLSEKKRFLGLEHNNLSGIFPSDWIMGCAAASSLFKKKKLAVIPNSIDHKVFKPISQKEARSFLDLPEDIFILLFIASDMNESRKGIDILCKSLQVGIEGPLQDLVRQDKILLLLVGHSVSNEKNIPPVNNRILNFIDGSEKLNQAYNSADIMVFCSREDNLPNTIIEAMSCGLPTVAYDVGGVGDIIKHTENGYLVPPGNHLAFAETIAHTLKNRAQREKLRNNCLAIAKQKYFPQIQARAYLKFFENLIAHAIEHTSPMPIVTSPGVHTEILRRITNSTNLSGLPLEDSTEAVDKWLHEAVVEDSIYYLTPPRDYQHEEQGYDLQYGIAADDFTYGNGLGRLLMSRNCDFSAPALEIGSGTGVLTLGMCQKNHFPLFIASDASPAFIHIVKDKLERTNNFNENIRLAVIDGDALASAPKQSFSLIVLKATLHHIIDPEQFIKNISELLVPNGMLVFHEPFWEGCVLLGMMAQTLMDRKYNVFSRKLWQGLARAHVIMPNRYTEKISKWAQASHFAKLQLLIDTMKASARRDIDKSDWEDKHLFKVSDIMQWGHDANLDVEFIANRELNEFAENVPQIPFSYRYFIFTYISKCMNYGDQFAKDFEADLGSSFDYLDQIAANNNSPEYHGIFLYRKR